MTVSATTGCCGVIAGGATTEPVQTAPATAPAATPAKGGSTDSYCCEPADATTAGTVPAPTTVVDANSGKTVSAPATTTAATGSTGTTASTSGTDTPPAPITTTGAPAGNGSASTTTPTAGTDPSGSTGANATSAAQLATWPQWQQAFGAIGVDPANVARIGTQPLTDQQLAQVFVAMKHALDARAAAQGTTGSVTPSGQAGNGATPATGSTPGTTSTPDSTGTSAWSPAWEQRFASLGATADQLAQLKALAAQKHSTDAQLEQLYQQLAKSTGWSPKWQQRFAALGGSELPLPQQFVQAYKDSGATGPALQSAYNHAAERLAAFKARNGGKSYAMLVHEHVDPAVAWTAILNNTIPADLAGSRLIPATDKNLESYVNHLHVSHQPAWKKFAQMGFDILPGVDLAEFAIGKKLITGQDVDRTSPMNIAMAALSGITAFTAVRGAMNLRAGFKAIASVKAGTSAIEVAGGPVSDAALGSLRNMTAFDKLRAITPMTKTHSAVLGWGAASRAADAYVNGGRAALSAAGESGTLQTAVLDQVFHDISTGNASVMAGRNGYWGNMRPVLPLKQRGMGMALETGADGRYVIRLPKAFKAADGTNLLAGMLEPAGARLVSSPEWLQSAPGIGEDIARFGNADLATFGQRLAGQATTVLGAGVHTGPAGAVLGKVLPGPAEYLAKLAKSASRSDAAWYDSIAQGAAARIAGAAAPAAATTAGAAATTAAGAAATGAAAAAAPVAAAVAHSVGAGGATGAGAGVEATASTLGQGGGVDAVEGASQFVPHARLRNGKVVSYGTEHGFRGAITKLFGRMTETASGKSIKVVPAAGGTPRYYRLGRDDAKFAADFEAALGTRVSA